MPNPVTPPEIADALVDILVEELGTPSPRPVAGSPAVLA